MKYLVFVQLLITVVSLFGVLNVKGNTPLRKGINTLEMRVNSIEIRVNTDNTVTRTNIAALEQDIESLNISLSILEDQVCPLKENDGNLNNAMPGQSHSTENDDVLQLNKNVLLAGFADEKKWLRDKIEWFQNKMDDSLSVIKSNINKYKTEIGVKFDDLARENNIKFEDHRKDITDETESARTAYASLRTELIEMNTRINETEANMEKYVSSVITEINKTLNFEIKTISRILSELKTRIPCENGWTKFGRFCYLYFDSLTTYSSARNKCSLIGATVADVESQAENDFLFQLAANSGQKWTYGNEGNIFIGITDENVEDEWISDRSGTKAKFMNMRSGQPDGRTNQNCMVMGFQSPYDKWNDLECHFNQNFICKKEL